ncbi:MAG: RdgB/HAM1 family non-canonical purine NTP pyrophosphatase [Clostridia bacterium]|nr:RdgB/HAM1 family non-canonical purine NTP pyrophosphatase [Clostridia bacterium]
MYKKVIVVASTNVHKIEEISRILPDYIFISMAELGFDQKIEETGESFAENARIKAEAVSKALKLPALADDSGLSVDALGGEPGIFSSRYSGGGDAENRALLLRNMKREKDRRAHFCCCVCLCERDGTCTFGEGETYGRILEKEEGSQGFGYDSIFFSDDLKKSFGTASAEEKNAVSHRARALFDLRRKLEKAALSL